MLLPFYIMRYEKRGHEVSEDPQLFQELLNEYEVIRSKLKVEITEVGRSELFSDLIGLITRISMSFMKHWLIYGFFFVCRFSVI